MEQEKKVLVSIVCATFNHENYIRKCLEGFVMQKTSFPFEAIVHDDASTDGTASIVREFAEKYPDIIKPIFEKENLWSKKDGSLNRVLEEAATGKYVATCEGDDYWIDPYKLQKQVDFLESHQDYSLSHGGFQYVNCDDSIIPAPNVSPYTRLPARKKDGFLWQDHLVSSTPIMYCTCMYRNGLLKGEFAYLDHSVFMSCARQGKVHYIESEVAAYRINPEGTMRSRQKMVIQGIRDSIFCQLYYYTNSNHYTDKFYCNSLSTYISMSEALISSLIYWSSIGVKDKSALLKEIVLKSPCLLLLSPIALIKKLLRRL